MPSKSNQVKTPPPEYIPICSQCKKIRLPDGSWEIIESYISRRFLVVFTHTLCPDDLESGRPRSF